MQLTLPRPNTFARDVLLIGLSSLLISLMGQFAIPLPFTPVPVSFRFQTILALGVLLGSRRAFLATCLFLAQGLAGLPVFTSGASGIAGLLGPTGGYILAYPVAAYIVGAITERKPTLMFAGLAFVLAHLIVYASGMSYLSLWVGLSKAFTLGVAPFLFVDLLKSILALSLVGWMRRA